MAIDLNSLKARYPSYNITSAVEAPGGGVWALGEDGGVFAVDGAPYLGSYWDDRMVAPVHRNDPTRRFASIILNDRGGYAIVSKTGEVYNSWDGPTYNPNDPGAPGTGTPGAKDPGAPAPEYDERAAVRAALTEAGLGSLFDAAWNYYMGDGGGNIQAVLDWLPTSDPYKARFPGIPSDWKPAEYLEYEFRVKQVLSPLPKEFWDEPSDIGNFLANNWSVDEIGQAVTLAQQAVLTMPAEDKAFLAELGVNTADLTAFYLDPDKKGGDLLSRKITTGRAQLGGAVQRAGLNLTAAEATNLYDIGVSADDAAQRAAAFAPGGQLGALLSETAEESEDLGRQTAADFLQGPTETGTAAQGKLDRRRAQRQARFEGGGGAATFGQGRSGLG